MAQSIPVDSVRTLDAMPLVTDSLKNQDSTLLVQDSTLVLDSLQMLDSMILAQDSTEVDDGISDDAITDPIFSEGRDSTTFILGEEKRVLIYGNAKVTMEDMELTADFIDFNMESKVAFARGTYDTLGNVTGRPVFKQGSETYTMDSMYYNFESQKAKIYTVVTQQQDGYLHGDAIKRMPDNTIYVKDGKYTTCDHEHPHYYLALTKAKVIPNDKVVTGPAYFVLEDVPMPLIIPFGLFPQSSSRSSGIIVPSYGEEVRRGFYFREGGYYFAFNDYVDLAITGDIFTLGSWRVGARSSYVWNYKFSGGFNISYAANIAGEKGAADYTDNRAFSLQWTHTQNPKFSPNKTFSASVNYTSSSYRQFNETTLDGSLTNTTNSSVSYSQVWPGTPFSMSIAATHSHNTRDSMMTLGLPTMSINMSRITPFKKKNRVGPEKWYEKIGVPLSIKLQNTITAKETEFDDLANLVRRKMKNGLSYNTSLSIPFTIFSFINLSPSITYTGRVYLNEIEKRWVPDTQGGHLRLDTVQRLSHNFDFSTSVSMSTRLYGMMQFKAKSKVQAIRHVMTPSISMSWRPDFSDSFWGMYKSVQVDSFGRVQRYSRNEGGLYGTAGAGKNMTMSFSLGNTLEMKVRSKSDTAEAKSKKIKLLESLSFSSTYNFLKDSMKLANILVSGRTTLFQGFGIDFGATLSPYAINESGREINRWQIKDGSLVRLISARFSFGYSFNKTQKYMHQEQYSAIPALDPTGMYDGMKFSYVDFNLPWSFSFSYSFSYNKPGHVATIMQTLNFNGDISLTKNWKIGMQSGFDFDAGKITSTSINIHRDLHCWEFRFSWIPMGSWQSWNFSINVKSALLKDLKYDKRQSRFDQMDPN